MAELSATPTTFETLPETMYLTESISSVATSLKLNYVPLAITSGILLLDEGTAREERVSFGTVTNNGDGTATYGDLRRALAYGGGTAYAGSQATAYEHTANSSTARLVIAHEYLNKTAFKDAANTFTEHQTLDTTKELRFNSSATAIWKDGSGNLSFKDASNATKTLTQLAALAGSDEKVKVSSNDTTQRYLSEKLTGGDGISVTEISDGGDEDLDIDITLATDPGLEFSSGDLRVKIKSNGGITRDSDGLSVNSAILSLLGLYGDGSDGAVTWSASTNLNPANDFEYTTATLDAGQTLSVSSVNTPLVIKNTGNVTINGTVDMNGKGGAGGAGAATTGASSTAGTAGNSRVTAFTVGAGGGTTSEKGGGGGASMIANGSQGGGTGGAAGSRLDSSYLAMLESIFRGVACGGGGGGGGAGNNASGIGDGNGGDGGAGGGALLWFIGGNLTLGASSIIRANGANGSNGVADSTSGSSGSGGGAGGGGTIVIVVAGTITNGGVTVSAAAGSVGTGYVNGGAGGAGKVLIISLATGTVIQSS